MDTHRRTTAFIAAQSYSEGVENLAGLLRREYLRLNDASTGASIQSALLLSDQTEARGTRCVKKVGGRMVNTHANRECYSWTPSHADA